MTSAPAGAAPWQLPMRQQTTAFVLTRDVVLQWDKSEIRAGRGTVVHVQAGSPLWEAYGGEDALRPVYGGQSQP